MKIGVAIPCTKKHLIYLNRCLNSIECQTVKPKMVSVSVSDCEPQDLPELIYSFKLIVVSTPNKQNASTNRNIAANNLTGIDIISFIDADDEMYHRRLEYIAKAFQENGSDFILHNYRFAKDILLHKRYLCVKNGVVNNPHHCGVMADPKLSFLEGREIIHHGHISVNIQTWQKEKFYEEDKYVLWEDSEYCKRLLLKNYKNSYIYTQLTIYYK